MTTALAWRGAGRVAAALGALLALGAGCGGASPDPDPRPAVCLGSLSPLLSSKNEWEAANLSIQLAIEQVNAAGGVVLGGVAHRAVLQALDDGGSAATGLARAQELKAAGCTTLIGPAYSSVILGPSPIYDPASPVLDGVADWAIANHVLLISPAATSPAISSLPDDGYVWRTAPSDALQGRLAAEHAYLALGARRASVLFRDDAYGNGLTAVFVARFTALGGAVVAQSPYPALPSAEAATHDYLTSVDIALGPAPDLIYLVSYRNDGAKLTKDLRQHLPAPPAAWPAFLGTDGTRSQVFVNDADPEVLTGMHGVYPSIDAGQPDLLAFRTGYLARYPGFEPQPYSPFAYDAAVLALLAMQAAGSSEPALVRAQLAAVSRTDAGDVVVRPGQLAAGLAALAAGGGVDYLGASGAIDFDANGDPGSASYAVYQIVRDPLTSALVVETLETVTVSSP
jgi:ABC-type branched-subunit amino acid transport system substrate-binding protein